MNLFTDAELKAFDAFAEEHKDCYTKNNPNKHNIEFVIRTGATGIGMQTYIKCSCCGAEKDVTDYSMW